MRDLAPIRSLPKTVQARHFNRVRLALLRVSNPLRVSLTGRVHRADMVLRDDAWFCVDRCADDLPLIAWTNFQLRGRNLIDPVHCTLHLYHSHSGLLIGPALSMLDQVLDRMLYRAVP